MFISTVPKMLRKIPKLTPMMVRLGNRTYRAWGSKIGLKNRELNGSGSVYYSAGQIFISMVEYLYEGYLA